jgi:polyisoprenoid-binding protein YceI
MTVPTRRWALLALGALVLGPSPAISAPTRYALRQSESRVGFRFTLSGVPTQGSMPVQSAEIVIDPQNLAASRVDVTVKVIGAQTSLFFATQALVGPQVLDAARFPTIRFVSRSVQLARDGRLSGGARISGLLTMRGVTRPITLNANLLREPGSAPDDLRNLIVRLDGVLNRSAFGATGYPDLVGNRVDLDILAVITALQ